MRTKIKVVEMANIQRNRIVGLLIFGLVVTMVPVLMALPKGIIKGRIEVSQELREKNVYEKDIYHGIFLYTFKKKEKGYIIPMVSVYDKYNNLILQIFTYLDFTKIDLIKGAYGQYFVYTPHVENYHRHEIEIFMTDENHVKNYDTVIATQTLFAKEVADRRRTKITATDAELDLLNKYRRDLKPPLTLSAQLELLKSAANKTPADKKNEKNKPQIDWTSPFAYGFKWGGFDKKDNFLEY
ncbi:hypothetical protein JW964_24360 [candidate division KSB1 bacterium]|nr:hypothetical protein [candidate division KSB1 bacterium]